MGTDVHATDAATRRAERLQCRNAVIAIALMAAVVVASVMVRGFALATGPSLLAAAAAGVALYLLLGALVCRAVPSAVVVATVTSGTDQARSHPQPPPKSLPQAGNAGQASEAAPVQQAVDTPVFPPRPPERPGDAAANAALATEPPPAPAAGMAVAVDAPLPAEGASDTVAPGTAMPAMNPPEADAVQANDIADADPLPPVRTPAPRQMDRALMMALAATRAAPADRRTLPTDTRRARIPKPVVETKSAAAGKITKAAKGASAAPGPLAALVPSAPVRSARPRLARGDATLPPKHDSGPPVAAGGIDAAIERSRHASTVKTGDAVRLERPRGGVADDLKLIRGVGPKLEALLHAAGIWHFDQIATWKARDIAEIDAALKGFHGRITRDGWVKQARTFVAMGTTGRKPGRARRKKADS